MDNFKAQSIAHIPKHMREKLNNFPAYRLLGFDTRKMGAITFENFLSFAWNTDLVFSEREKGNLGDKFVPEARKCFLFLDANGDGLLSPLDADRMGKITDLSRAEASYAPKLKKGKPYSHELSDTSKIIANAAKLFMDNKLKSINESREIVEHGGACIYKYSVPLLYLAKEQESATILHLSDIHFDGRNGKKAKKTEQKLDFLSTLRGKIDPPDIVVVTGDIITKSAEDFSERAKKALAGLFPKALRFFVFGNHDIDFGGEKKIPDALCGSGYSNLTNRHMEVEVRGKPFAMTGLDDLLCGKPALPGFAPATQLIPNVLATHNLDAVDGSSPRFFDLVLTGHTHMGEKNFLLFDGYAFLKLFKIYGNINSQKDEWGVASQRTTFHITAGLGTHNTRFNTTPEGVTLITLVRG